MKRLGGVLALLLVVGTLASCSSQSEGNIIEDDVKPVKVMMVKEQEKTKNLNYIGIVASEELRKMAFKTSGKIADIPVEKGMKIHRGEALATLDTKDLIFSLEASKAKMEGAKEQYEKAVKGATEEEIKQAELNVKKARDAYQFAEDQYKKLERLYEQGGISKQKLDEVKLDMELCESNLNQALEAEKQIKKGVREEDKKALLTTYEQAKLDYEHKMSMLEDAVLYSDVDGYVVDILYKKGEIAAAGTPVVVVRNNRQIVKVGLTQKDISKISVGMPAEVVIDDVRVEGKVSHVEQIPDQQTRTYNVDVMLSEQNFPLGAIAKVKIRLDIQKGVWIPLTAVLSNGEDYVFTVQNDIARKRKVTILGVKGTQVFIEGMQSGEKLVVEGMKRLTDGDKVSIKGEWEEETK